MNREVIKEAIEDITLAYMHIDEMLGKLEDEGITLLGERVVKKLFVYGDIDVLADIMGEALIENEYDIPSTFSDEPLHCDKFSFTVGNALEVYTYASSVFDDETERYRRAVGK